MSELLRVHLDTDIGDDIDDAFCLALLLASPEVVVHSITTAFLYTDRRADLAAEMCAAAGKQVPIVPGLRGTMASRFIHPYSDRKLSHQASRTFTHPQPEDALLPMLRDARRNCDVIFAIGPMTNIAATLIANPDVTAFPRVMAMAAEFQIGNFIEWNIALDPEAASLVFNAGVPIDLIPWSIGPAAQLAPADIVRLRSGKSPLTRVLINYCDQFWQRVPHKAHMYDPMTVVALLRPDLFDWQRGRVTVELQGGPAFGMTFFKRDDNGPHRVAMGVRAEEAKAFMIDRIVA